MSVAAVGKLGRVLQLKPDRVAAAWRRVRMAEAKQNGFVNLLDGVVDSFISELGATLAGAEGHAWSRTHGILRISPERGVRALYDEFGLLRRCLNDMVSVLGASLTERRMLAEAFDEAVESAVAIARRFSDGGAPEPKIPFGGIVVEFFERAAAVRSTGEEPRSARVH